MKKVLLVILVLVLAGAGWFGWQIKNGIELDKTSRAFVETEIPALAEAKWYGGKLQPLVSEAFKQAVTVEDWQKVSTIYWQGLGALESYGPCDGQAMINFHNGQKLVTSEYVCEAQFEKGEAVVTTGLIHENDAWKILKINVNSPAFLPKPQAAEEAPMEETPAEETAE